MADPDAAYVYERAQLTAGDLADWTVDLADVASGACPTCGHLTTTNVQSMAVAQGPGVGARAAGVVRFFECQCGQRHSDGDQGHMTCGRWWLATVFPQGHTPRIVSQADETLLGAARAFAQDQPLQEAAVRATAEKWIAGVTALFGLFGLAGIVTAKDAVAGVDRTTKIIAGALLLVAIIGAAAALFQTYRAAYGLPKTVDVEESQQLREWFADRQQNTRKTVVRLRRGVLSALVALVALIASVGVIRFASLEAPASLIKFTRVHNSFVCGELLDTTSPGELRVRQTGGTVQPVSAAEIATSTNVATCPK